jgi:hypothetical protein
MTAVPVAFVRRASAAHYYAVLVGLFLGVRGITTMAGGPSFARPGDGWRALGQLIVAAVLFAGLLSARPGSRAILVRAVLAIGVLYAAETALGFVNGHDILGVIPVDTRDKTVVHPLIAVLGFAAAMATSRRSRQ